MSTNINEQSTPPTIDIPSLLKTLNPAQLNAVQHDPSIPLQILAGPGSGKTKVLTSRIVYLIKEKCVPPHSICAVTFTNKAANEMRERLTKLIGKDETQALQLGTFHSLCAKFLRKQSQLAGLKGNFTITDADEGKRIVAGLLKQHEPYMSANDIKINENDAVSKISQAKAKGQSVTEFWAKLEKDEQDNPPPPSDDGGRKKTAKRIIAEIYEKYEKALKSNNALDFDDLLVYGVKLFKFNRSSVSWCSHILVDEFQDTNATQYALMKAIGFRNCVTIVGDPDQSIYGWRSAEVTNLSLMCDDFPGTQQIFLEQNYRSTSSILKTSLAIVSEDKKRIAKSLHTSHPSGLTPVLRQCDGEKDEAGYISYEIKRCVANMGGSLKWGDFAILLRFNALSRPLENALQKQGIPCKILGGHRFFERMEIKDLLSYMHLVDNPSFTPSFSRAANVPPRGIGDKTLEVIAARAESLNLSHLEVVEKIHDCRIPDFKPTIKSKIGPFVKVIRALRKMNDQDATPADMLRKLIDLVKYEEHLKKMGKDWEGRWENVQELITFANEVEVEAPAVEPTIESEKAESEPALRRFLQVSMLDTGIENESEDATNKVTITTCHAAKGLEWPVVLVPSVEHGTFPFYRTDDTEEERRLLYVACTRAQTLLYVTYCNKRIVAGNVKEKKLSDFISKPMEKHEGLFSLESPHFNPQNRAIISQVLNRLTADEKEVEERVADFERNGDHGHVIYSKANKVTSPVYMSGVNSSQGMRTPNAYETPTIVSASQVHASMSGAYANSLRGNPGFQRPQVAGPGPGVNYHSVAGASFPQAPHGSNARPLANSQFPPSRPPFPSSGSISSATSARHVQQSNSDNAVRGSGFAPSPQQGSSTQFMKYVKTGTNSTTSEWIHDQNKPPRGSSVQRLSAPGSQSTIAGGEKNSHINYGTSIQVNSVAPTTGSLPPNASYQAIPTDIPPASTSGVKRRLGMGTRTTGYTNTKFKKFKPAA